MYIIIIQISKIYNTINHQNIMPFYFQNFHLYLIYYPIIRVLIFLLILNYLHFLLFIIIYFILFIIIFFYIYIKYYNINRMINQMIIKLLY